MARLARFALFIGVVAVAVIGLHLYAWARLVRDPGLPPAARHAATVFLALLAANTVLAFAYSRLLPLSVARILVFVPYVWMAMILWIFLSLVAVDVGRLAVFLVSRLVGRGPALAAVDSVTVSRVAAMAVVGLALVFSGISLWSGARPPVVRTVEVTLERLPPALDGFTIAQLTDLHLGPTLGQAWLADVVERTNALSPDLVAITGDLVDLPPERLLPSLSPLADLRAAHGVFFVTGNHELYVGWEQWRPHLARLGIRPLENERVTVERNGESFDLVGTHDLEAQRMGSRLATDLEAALSGRDPSRETVLLAHQARMADEAARHDVGLMLSGHNHGGQIWPWRYFVRLQQPFVDGLHQRGRTVVYVSQGTGYWGPPMRLGSSSEIALVRLRSPRRGR